LASRSFQKYARDFSVVIENLQLAYEAYSRWLKDHVDLQIGANYLTNQQLYWQAVTVSHYAKFHRTVPKRTDPHKRLVYEYTHVFMKRHRGFQEAFRCNMTEEEEEKLRQYLVEYGKLVE
jgi:hypothetical protein